MQKSKNAFTMIELVFVIVILGILAIVAIPKLAATRDDAETSRDAHLIMTGTTEIVSYAVAKGQIDSNFSNMSNSISSLASRGKAVLSNNTATITIGSIADCVSILVDASDENLTITFGNANSDSKCQSVQSLINLDVYPVQLKGSSIVY